MAPPGRLPEVLLEILPETLPDKLPEMVEVFRLRKLLLPLLLSVLVLVLVGVGVSPTSTVVPGANEFARPEFIVEGRFWVEWTKMRPRS